MALNFPSSPTDGQTYTSGDVTWTYNAARGTWETMVSGSLEAHTHLASAITDFSEAVDDRIAALLTAGSGISLTYDDTGNILTIAATGGGGGNKAVVTVNFGLSFTGKATPVVVTGQTWVTPTTGFVAKVVTASGVDPDETHLLDFDVHISDIVDGVGFTVTVYSKTEAKGTYDVVVIGV